MIKKGTQVAWVADLSLGEALLLGQESAIDRLGRTRREEFAFSEPGWALLEELSAVHGRVLAIRERLLVLGSEVPRLPWTREVTTELVRLRAISAQKKQKVSDLVLANWAHAVAHGAQVAAYEPRAVAFKRMSAHKLKVPCENWALRAR